MNQQPLEPDTVAISAGIQPTLRRLADSARFIVWTTDVQDVCIQLNRSAPQQGINGEDQIRFSEWLRVIHPEDVALVRSQLAVAKNARDEYQLEYRVVRSDGTIRRMLESAAPRFSQDGQFAGYSGSIVELTAHQQAPDRPSASRMEHRLLTENVSDLICYCGPDNAYLYVSPSYSRILGTDTSEVIGKNVFDFIHPDDVPTVQAECNHQLKTGAEPRLVEIRKLHKDGHYIWTGAKIRMLVDRATNTVTGAVTVCRDITAERQAREDLKKSEGRFRSLTNLSSDWYWETDEHDYVTYVSDGIQKVVGIDPQLVLGKRRGEFAEEVNQAQMSAYRQRVAHREPFRDLPWSAKHPNTGRRFYVSISGEPVFEDGVFKGYRGIGKDVTAEKELSNILAQLADENKALIENSPDVMMLFDHEGRIQNANRAVIGIMGYTPEELLGRHYLEFVTPDTREHTEAIAAAMLNGKEKIVGFENCWHRKDGRSVNLSWSLARSTDGKHAYATARDVTESHRTRNELHRVNRQLSTLLESIGDAFFSIDEDWRITFANLKSAAFVGVDRDAVIGKILFEAVPDFVDSSAYPHYQHAMQTRENTFFETYYEPVGAWVETRIYAYKSGLSIFFNDITERHNAEQAIRESEQRLREMIELTPAGYVLTNATGIVVDVNPALCQLCGYAKEELIGQPLLKFLEVCPVNRALEIQGGASSAHGKEAVIRHKYGRAIHALMNLTVKHDNDGNALSLTAFITDITERKQAENQLEHLATHDTLTGLPNRTFINQRLQSLLGPAQPDDSIAVMFIDLDRFKEVNDSLGHAPGDMLLCQVALRLQQCLRQSDIVARLGGDEFVVTAHCSEGEVSAYAIADKLLTAIAQPFDIEGQEVFVSASIGISMFGKDGRTKDLLFQNADTAMYQAKAAGRNRYRFFKEEMSAQAKMRMTLEHSLRHALERQEFELHYQPRVNLDTMAVNSVEALIRWNHPQLGRVSPLDFIPIAEDRGFIEPIGQWVLEEASRQAKRLTGELGRPLRVSVNLSARQLKCPNLVEQVVAILAKTGLAPECLELELTESALIEDVEASVDMLKRLKKLGLILSVDDFGTGYSGLSYLKQFPVDILKLDRSFVHQQPEGISSFEFIKAFVDMAHALKLSVVAEGIETDEILQMLIDANCDEGQGYFFAKPLAIDQLQKFLSGITADNQGLFMAVHQN